MGLFGNKTPKGDDPVWFPIKIMGEAQSYIHTQNVRKGYERELGERLTPYKGMLRHVEMAYEIIAYPYITEIKERPGELSPHRAYTDKHITELRRRRRLQTRRPTRARMSRKIRTGHQLP